MQDVTAVAAVHAGPDAQAACLAAAQRVSRRKVRVAVLRVLAQGQAAKAATSETAAVDIAEVMTVKVAHVPGMPVTLPVSTCAARLSFACTTVRHIAACSEDSHMT